MRSLWEWLTSALTHRRLLLAICLVSLLVRLALPLSLDARPSGTSAWHAMTAFSVARGEGFHLDSRWLEEIYAAAAEQEHLTDMEDMEIPADLALVEPSTQYPPGYPLLMAITFKLAGQARYVYIQVLALVVDALVPPILLYFLGSSLFSRRAGLVAAALYSVWASFAFLAFEVRPEAFLSSVSLGLLAAFYMVLRRGGWRWIAVMAVLIAIGVNLRSDMLGTVPIIAIAMAMAARGPLRSRVMRGAGLGAALAAAALVSLVPYGLIQREAFGEFSFSTPALGVVAWQGISEYPNPWGAVLSDTHVVNLLAAQGLEHATPEGDRYLLDKVKDAVSEDPLWFVGTTIDRAKRVLFMQHNWGFPGAIQDGLDIPGRQVSAHCESWSVLPGGSITCGGLAVGYIGIARFLVLMDWALWIGAIAGVLLYHRRYPYVWLLLVFPLSRLVPFSFIHVEPRYILYGMGPSLVLAAALLVSAWESHGRIATAMRSVRPRQKVAV